jgi:hypothetical protein
MGNILPDRFALKRTATKLLRIIVKGGDFM